MSKIFNVNAVCRPEIHYMADITGKLKSIKEMIDAGQYFTINRARQYGKTTTLKALSKYIEKDYLVISLDFQMFGDAKFKNENIFSLTFAKLFLRELKSSNICFCSELKNITDTLNIIVTVRNEDFELQELFEYISDICGASEKEVVLIVDEVDSAASNKVFLDFLSQLRGYYIDRDIRPALKSVILAGVYDIKNLKNKFVEKEDHKINSPWNIAADFLVDMSLSKYGIAGMIEEYENDYNTGMDINKISGIIYDYTSGYPFLVSRLCKLLDETVSGSKDFPDKKSAWTERGLAEAVKLLINEKNTLFDSLTGKLEDYHGLKNMIYLLLFNGNSILYNPLNRDIDIAEMFGFIKNSDGNAVIANRIFETVLYNLFLSEEAFNNSMYNVALQDKNQFIKNGHLDMKLILEKFVIHFNDLYGGREQAFYEEEGRRYFLLYLKPVINGTGNYYIEAQTRNMERTDVIVDYNGEQFIIEMKIWRGNAYNVRGEKQLKDYLDYYHLNKGYMLSFNFNKNKQTGVKEVVFDNKIIIEAVV